MGVWSYMDLPDPEKGAPGYPRLLIENRAYATKAFRKLHLELAHRQDGLQVCTWPCKSSCSEGVAFPEASLLLATSQLVFQQVLSKFLTYAASSCVCQPPDRSYLSSVLMDDTSCRGGGASWDVAIDTPTPTSSIRKG